MPHYVHHVPGRLRVTLPAIRNKRSRIEEIHDLLRDQPGINRVAVNQLTGSVVTSYDEDRIRSGEILNILNYSDYFDSKNVLPHQAHQSGIAQKAGQAMGKALVGWAVGRALEANGLSFLTAFI